MGYIYMMLFIRFSSASSTIWVIERLSGEYRFCELERTNEFERTNDDGRPIPISFIHKF